MKLLSVSFFNPENQLVSDIRRGNGDKLALFLQHSNHVMAIRRELLDLNAHPTTHAQVFNVKESAWEWKVLVRGPTDSPYEGGVLNFHVRFSHEYPFEPPVLSCLTRIYHPNFVPLLNGSMSLYGLLRRWDPEWRMRRLLKEVEQLLSTPDDDLIAEFEAETAQMLHGGGGVDTSTAISAIIANSKSKAARHPRIIALECIAAYRNNREAFNRDAQRLTHQCASHCTEVPIDWVPIRNRSSLQSGYKMLAQQQEVEADVRQEDQLRINEFGRNNASLFEIRERKKTLKDKLDTLDDANTDLMMGEGDNVQLFIGESFVESSEDFAQEYIEKRVEEANVELRKLQAEESKLETRQEALKKVLYSRFGQSINLEDK
ncbi:hypothetical protein PRIC1_013604 [Phytophthora ramorum]